MNKSAIQKYAIWARTEMIAQVEQRAYQYGITKDGYGEENAVTVLGRALSSIEQEQRWELIQQIKHKGYTQVMEEVAYTWFNRFIALRFMEVNNYLPSHIRVFSDSTGAFKPEILSTAMQVELDGLDRIKVAQMIDGNMTEELYRYLLLTQCNALYKALPKMFEKMGGYTELLLPNNILRADGILGRMVNEIPEEDWTDQVQIIGWLYQYYNSELKDETFALLKKNIKITKERIPSATQLFTPDWIVRYLVENSLGRIWVEGHPDDTLKANWKYYLEAAEQELEVQEQLNKIRSEYTHLTPQDIKVIDPCMGSGHILVYAFDVMIQIYKSCGYSERDAAKSILECNLYGLDIDDRAAQLAYFAVMMKARQYDRRIFSRGVQPNVHAIKESNAIKRQHLKYFGWQMSDLERNLALNQINVLLDEFVDAKEYGSILNISKQDWDLLDRFTHSVDYSGQMTLETMGIEDTKGKLLELLRIAATMAQKYDVVVTNPPYLGNASEKLAKYLQNKYPTEKYDLYAAFMKKGMTFLTNRGFEAMITGESWMFLPSFADMRLNIIASVNVVSMAHLGTGAFDGGFGTTAFIFRKGIIKRYIASYLRAVHLKAAEDKAEFISEMKLPSIHSQQDDFLKIDGQPFAYWMNAKVLDSFSNSPLSNHAITKAGIVTGNNEYFMKLWHEVVYPEITFSAKPGRKDLPKWVPAHKGGGNCRYYGNLDYIMRISDLWNPALAQSNMRRGDQDYYYREGFTWSTLSNRLAFRYSPKGFVYETKGSMCFPRDADKLLYILGILNSSLCDYIMNILSPTLDYNRSSLLKMPYVEDATAKEKIEGLVEECINLAKEDWDSFEISWDFRKHPLI